MNNPDNEADKDALVERLIILRDATKGIDCVMSPMDREAIGQAIIKIESLTAQNEAYDKLCIAAIPAHSIKLIELLNNIRRIKQQGEDSE